MTQRTYAQYTDQQVIQLCTDVTLDDLLSRGLNSADQTIKPLLTVVKTAEAHECVPHLLEWPDGRLACVIRPVGHLLTPNEKLTAYRRVSGGY